MYFCSVAAARVYGRTFAKSYLQIHELLRGIVAGAQRPKFVPVAREGNTGPSREMNSAATAHSTEPSGRSRSKRSMRVKISRRCSEITRTPKSSLFA